MSGTSSSRIQGEMFDQAVVASGARRPDALASDGAMCARLDWFGLQDVEARLSVDGTTLSFGVVLTSGAFHSVRSEPLGHGWDDETLESLLIGMRSRAETFIPPAYVEWFTQMGGRAAERERVRVEPAHQRQVRPSDLSAVITVAREVFGNAIVLDAFNARDFHVRAVLYESFELEISTDGFQHTRRLIAGVRSESGRFHAVPHRHLYEGSWSPEEITAQLTDIRTWCVKVLPEDFLAELELAYGSLPGISAHE